MAKIVVIGSLNMDIVAVTPRLPLAGETILGIQYLKEPGGKGANQAYAASKLGGDVAILGRVGTDDHGKQMRANLEAMGCDVGGLQAVEGNSGVAVIFVAESGQNSIVVVPGANPRRPAMCSTPLWRSRAQREHPSSKPVALRPVPRRFR
jgi:ribokinase